MVDVTHDGDHRGPGFEVGLDALVLAEFDVEAFEKFAVLILGRDHLNVVVQFSTEQFQRLVTHGLGGGDDLTQAEQRRHQGRGVHVDPLGEVRQGRPARQSDSPTIAHGDLGATQRGCCHIVEFLPLGALGLAALAAGAPAEAATAGAGGAAEGATCLTRSTRAATARTALTRTALAASRGTAAGGTATGTGTAAGSCRGPTGPRVTRAARATTRTGTAAVGAAGLRGRGGIMLGFGRGPPGAAPSAGRPSEGRMP